ncbi:MAG: methionine gamma-lyase family protein [Clostridia bacterium]|nr:methionine gamma-lyase family protein [Clostridia bacterium]
MTAKTLIADARASLCGEFDRIREIRAVNQRRVLDAFRQNGVAARHFAPSTGYGYNDESREKLDAVFAAALGMLAAIVRPHFASGTHALSVALQALCPPGTRLVAFPGEPYDTIRPTIEVLKRNGVVFDVILNQRHCEAGGLDPACARDDGEVGQLPLSDYGGGDGNTVFYIQRSRGYEWRPSLSINEINSLYHQIKRQNPNSKVIVDNCYGEFVEDSEPCADLLVGSLIKNPGGGLAPTGAYIAGNGADIEKAADRLFAPGIGGEVGSYAASYLPFFQGLFMAPQAVAQARMGALLAAEVFQRLGYETMPGPADAGDLVCAIKLNSAEKLEKLCAAIQKASPIDAMATPVPWAMPGYDSEVIMAAGTFVQGASIELSCDGPMRPPYIAYLQGGLCLDHIVVALEEAVGMLIYA